MSEWVPIALAVILVCTGGVGMIAVLLLIERRRERRRTRRVRLTPDALRRP